MVAAREAPDLVMEGSDLVDPSPGGGDLARRDAREQRTAQDRRLARGAELSSSVEELAG